MKEDRSQRRLFFALWPSDAIRAALAQRRQRIEGLSGRRVPDHNLHLTLLFLGDQPAEALDRIVGAAERVEAARLGMVLDRFGWFEGARVAWLGGPSNAAGRSLVAQLAAGMTALGLQLEDRAWVPHVSLFRKVQDRPVFPDIEPLAWPIAQFELIESVPGQPYQSLATFKLC